MPEVLDDDTAALDEKTELATNVVARRPARAGLFAGYLGPD